MSPEPPRRPPRPTETIDPSRGLEIGPEVAERDPVLANPSPHQEEVEPWHVRLADRAMDALEWVVAMPVALAIALGLFVGLVCLLLGAVLLAAVP